MSLKCDCDLSFLNIKWCLCDIVTEYSLLSLLWFFWMWLFCININWTKCFQINVNLEHDALSIIGVAVSWIIYRMLWDFAKHIINCSNSQTVWHFTSSYKRYNKMLQQSLAHMSSTKNKETVPLVGIWLNVLLDW